MLHFRRPDDILCVSSHLDTSLQEGAAVATPYYPYYEDVTGHGTNVTHSPGLNDTVAVYRKLIAA